MTLISTMCPLKMDGSDFSLHFQDFWCPNFFQPQELQFSKHRYPDSLQIYDTCLPKWTAQIISGFSLWTSPISCPRECRYPDSWCLDLYHVSPLTDGPDLPGISRLEVSQFSPPRESWFLDDCYPNDYTSRWDFSSIVHEGLTPSQFSIDPTIFRSPNQDPTVQIRSSCALSPEAKLRAFSPDPTTDGFFALDLTMLIISSCALALVLLGRGTFSVPYFFEI
jgi:hypothetical protein